MTRYNYAGHDDGLVITQPRPGVFVDQPMSIAELVAREPAKAIAEDIYRYANYAGVCYIWLWEKIAAAAQEAINGAGSDGNSVPLPKNEAQAELMAKVGMAWLEQHAPHRLRTDKATVPHA